MFRDHAPDNLPLASYDALAERLLRPRTVIISGEITQQLAASVASQFLAHVSELDE